MKLSILIPVYNEGATIDRVLRSIVDVALPSGIQRELVVINDASTQRTVAELETFRQVHPATALVYHHERVNQGKGWCLRRGIALATGDCIVIQDADLEYDPADHAAMLRPILEPWKPRDRQGVLDLGGLGDDRPAPLQAAQLTPVL